MLLRKVLSATGEPPPGGAPTPAPAPAPVPAPAPADSPEVAALKKEIGDLRKEAAGYRTKAKEQEDAASKAAAEKLETEKAAATAKGEWAKVVEIEKQQTKTKEDALKAAESELTRLKGYEGAVRSEVEALTKKLGDKVPESVKGLEPATALGILKSLDAAFAGPAAAKQTTGGAPNPVRPAVELQAMNPNERQAYLATLPHEELRKLVGAGRTASLLAHQPK